MSGKLKQFGAGPKWGLVTMVYLVPAIISHYIRYPYFAITQISSTSCTIIGISLLGFAAILYATAFITLRTGLGKGELVTQGLYSIVRHPLYTSIIFLFIPALALLVRSWLILPASAIAYIACHIYIRTEERTLLDQYGDDYKLYQNRTNAVFPVPRWGGKK